MVFEIVGQTIRSAGYQGRYRRRATQARLAAPWQIFDACAASAATTPCPILGFDNSKVVDSQGAVGQKNSGGINSDALAVRFNGASGASVKSRDEGRGDESFTTCAGTAVRLTTEESQLGLSVFWVKELNGEPELYCSEEYNSPGAGASAGWKRPKPQPMARGVESFQVMYGVDCAGPATPCVSDGVPDRWVSASDVGDTNWRNVRAVRIGMILRGPPGSSQGIRDVDDEAELDLYPLGRDFNSSVNSRPRKMAACAGSTSAPSCCATPSDRHDRPPKSHPPAPAARTGADLRVADDGHRHLCRLVRRTLDAAGRQDGA